MNPRVLMLVLGVLLLLAVGFVLRLGGADSGPAVPALQALSGPVEEPHAELSGAAPVRGLDAPKRDGERSQGSSRRLAPMLGARLLLKVSLVGRPAAGAQVFGSPLGKSLQSLGSTDASGQLQLRLDPGSWSLSVRAIGAALTSRVVWLTQGAESELRLELPTPAAIEGLVRDASGIPVRGSAMVWAWDTEEPDPASLLRKSRERNLDPRLFKVRTDARGFFRLTGLDPKRAYRLAAVGSGSISVQGQVTKAGDRAELRLSPVVARVVEFKASGKGRLPSPSLGGPGLEAQVQLVPGAMRLSLASHPELWLTPIGTRLQSMYPRAGILAPLVIAAVPPKHNSKNSKSSGSSARVELHFPGLKALVMDLGLSPLADPVQVTVAELLPAAGAATGSLRVELSLAAEIASALREDLRSLGTLRMRQENGRVLTVELPSLAKLPLTVFGVPAGRWELSFQSRDGKFNPRRAVRPRGSVTIKPGRQASASLDLTDLTAVQLELKMDAKGVLGGDWADSVILTCGADGGAGRFVSIPRAPYLVLGLPPGPYVFRVLRLRGNQARGASAPLDLRAGELALGSIPLLAPKRR